MCVYTTLKLAIITEILIFFFSLFLQMFSYSNSNQSRRPQQFTIQGFNVGRSGAFSKAGSGRSSSFSQISSSKPIFDAPTFSNRSCGNNREVTIRNTNSEDISLIAQERERNVKIELASLDKYDERFPKVLKGDPDLFDDIKKFGWDKFVEKDGMNLSFKWPNIRRKTNIWLAKNLQDVFPPKLIHVAEDLLTSNEFFLENFKHGYNDDMDLLSEFADAISNNLIRDIMLGNFELPEQVPSLTLMVKDTSYKTIPTPIISDFDENKVMKLTPVINVAVFSGKRASKRDGNPKPLKKIASGVLEENNAKNPRNVATPSPGQSPLKHPPLKSHPQKL